MPSSFDSTDLFGSGPHRFLVRAFGEQLLHKADADPYAAGEQAIGKLDGEVLVRGRLVAADESGLWGLVDAIAAKLTDPPLVADLVDLHGREFKDYSFISFTPRHPIDRGRTFSLAYEARFVHFGGWS